MAKLTLSVDEAVVERAKAFARRQETSISALVERYLEMITRPARRPQEHEGEVLPPATARLRGLLRGQPGDRETHRRHLAEKFR